VATRKDPPGHDFRGRTNQVPLEIKNLGFWRAAQKFLQFKGFCPFVLPHFSAPGGGAKGGMWVPRKRSPPGASFNQRS